MERDEKPGADCLVVGGGLAGLACAQALVERGHTVQLFEGDSTVGGRARSGLHQGEPVDRGFQAVFRGYSETRAFLDGIGVGGDAMRAFARGFVVHDGTRWRRVGVSPLSLVRSGLATNRDLRILATTLAGTVIGPGSELDGPSDAMTTAEGLARLGVSEPLRRIVLEPLLQGILLDRDLGADYGYARFLMGTLMRGGAALPVDGMGMIADRASGAITRAGGMIWTGVRVAGLDVAPGGDTARGVRLADGRTVTARHVVLAVDARNAARLLAGIDDATAKRLPTEPAGMVSAAFALEAPLYAGRHMLIDAAAPEGDGRVDLVCQTTNVTRPGSPGPHIVIAQSATRGWTRVDEDAYVASVGQRIAAWAPTFPWQRLAKPIDVFRHEWAQYRPVPGVRRDLPGPRTALLNVLAAGDAVMHPSIEGAVASGRRAARIVDQLVR